MADWTITRYHMFVFRYKESKTPVQAK